MGEELIKSLFAVGTAIVGLAILSVILSHNANTAGVIQAAGSALGTDISAAVAPVSGGGSLGLGLGSGLGSLGTSGGLVYA